jgi:hypothetical protein
MCRAAVALRSKNRVRRGDDLLAVLDEVLDQLLDPHRPRLRFTSAMLIMLTVTGTACTAQAG